jgi:Cys-tRNA(Pro) deacylase
MKEQKTPVTSAIRVLKSNKIPFSSHLYSYIEKGGTKVAAQALKVEEHSVIKTIVFEDNNRNPLLVLMHGNCEVSVKKLARFLGVKSVAPADPKAALKHTGYQVGGTSPFGTRKTLPVYIEKSILDLETIYINGGKRGYLIGISPVSLKIVLNPTAVEIAVS